MLRIPVIHQTEEDVFCGTTKRTMLSPPHLIIAPLPYPSGLDLPGDAAAFADIQHGHRLESGRLNSGATNRPVIRRLMHSYGGPPGSAGSFLVTMQTLLTSECLT